MSSLESLFEAARADGPTEARKQAAWEEIAAATGVAGAAAATTIKPAAASSGLAMKGVLVKLGLLSAVVISAGGAAAVATTSSSAGTAARAPMHAAAVRTELPTHASAKALADEIDELDDAVVPVAAVAKTTTETPAVEPTTQPNGESQLAEETRLVTEARAALVRGDAPAALASIASAKRLPTRVLEPEELALEARAFRALGRIDDAAAAEISLRARFPNHALAR